MTSLVKSNVMRYSLMLVTALSLAGVGCKSSSDGKAAPEATRAVDSMRTIDAELVKADGEVDKVLTSIDQLQAGAADPKKPYADFSAAFDQLKNHAERVKSRREGMRANRQAYIQKWQSELDTIDNAEVRAALSERKKKVEANFDEMRETVNELRSNYQAFVGTLDGIERGLALDLNAAGVAAMKGPMDTAKKQGAEVKKSLAESRAEIEDIIGRMGGAPPAKK